MHNDDLPIGRVLTRRETLKLLSGATFAALVGCATPQQSATPSTITPTVVAPTPLPPTPTETVVTSTAIPTPAPALSPTAVSSEVLPICVVRPEMTEGPYFVDTLLNRSDIRTNSADGLLKAGIPFTLIYQVAQISNNACSPLAGAMVDIWHCDSEGVYSGVQDRSLNTPDQDFLRGHQLTNEQGVAKFLTIFPGWYPGRAVHIHFKIRTNASADTAYEFTSQLFFSQAATKEIYAQPPYNSRGEQDVLNERDGIYRSGGDQLLLTPLREGDGYTATFHIGLDLTDTAVGRDDGF